MASTFIVFFALALFSSPVFAQEHEDEKKRENKDETAIAAQEVQNTSVHAQAAPSFAPPVAIDITERGPKERSYVATEPIPEGYRPVRRFNAWPLAIGIAVFGLSYRSAVTAVIRTAVLDGGTAAKNRLELLIPVVGPFVVQDKSTTEQVFGIAQAVGLSTMLFGAFFRRTILLRNDYRAGVTVTPMFGPGTLGAAGTF
jgi:hypothetical protein